MVFSISKNDYALVLLFNPSSVAVTINRAAPGYSKFRNHMA